MAAGGGGAWKVAYADFVTAMMAFFLVMWITAQNKQMKIAVAHYFNDPFNSLSKTKGPEAAGSTTTGPLAPGSKSVMPSVKPGDPPGIKRPPGTPPRIGRKIDEHGPKPMSGEGNKSAGVSKPTHTIIHNGNEREIGAIVLFTGQSTELSGKAQDQLKRLFPVLQGYRQKIEIRGHARQLSAAGGDAAAWQLSYSRCMATMTYLIKAGIDADRFRLSQAGPNEPQTISQGAEKQILNSCVEVIVLPELADDLFGSREERAAQEHNP
jgi:chemotaxis protein MotB